MKPGVETKGQLIVAVIFLIFLIALFFGLMWSEVQIEKRREVRKEMKKIKNASKTAKTVEHNGKSFELQPGEQNTILVSSDDILNIVHSDNKKSNAVMDTGDGKIFSTVFLKEDETTTDLDAVEGSLVNESNYPVYFVEVSDDGRRWPKALLNPGEKADNILLDSMSIWQVVKPERQNFALANIKIAKNTHTIHFDGDRLYLSQKS